MNCSVDHWHRELRALAYAISRAKAADALKGADAKQLRALTAALAAPMTAAERASLPPAGVEVLFEDFSHDALSRCQNPLFEYGN